MKKTFIIIAIIVAILLIAYTVFVFFFSQDKIIYNDVGEKCNNSSQCSPGYCMPTSEQLDVLNLSHISNLSTSELMQLQNSPLKLPNNIDQTGICSEGRANFWSYELNDGAIGVNGDFDIF